MYTKFRLKEIAQTMRYLSEAKGDLALTHKRADSQLINALIVLIDEDNREAVIDIIRYYTMVERG